MTRPAAMARAASRALTPGSLAGRGDRDDPAATPGVELHHPGPPGEDRVVLADPRAVAGLEAGAPLAHDDLAAADDLSGEDLHAEHLGVGVAAVAAGAEALLMRHSNRSPSSCAPGPRASCGAGPRASSPRACEPPSGARPPSPRSPPRPCPDPCPPPPCAPAPARGP